MEWVLQPRSPHWATTLHSFNQPVSKQTWAAWPVIESLTVLVLLQHDMMEFMVVTTGILKICISFASSSSQITTTTSLPCSVFYKLDAFHVTKSSVKADSQRNKPFQQRVQSQAGRWWMASDEPGQHHDCPAWTPCPKVSLCWLQSQWHSDSTRAYCMGL